MVLYLDALEQILVRQMVLMRCIRETCVAWDLECPISDKAISMVEDARRQVVLMLAAGISELVVPKKI